MPQAPRSRAIRLSNRALARLAARFIGFGYVYGGNASRPGVWDCSSFISYLLHQARLALPGPGKWGDPAYPPNEHGPVVMDYANWDGATTVGTPQAGDLCIWVGDGPNGHIGIAISGTEMVSALNPQDGTIKTAINPSIGPAGAPLIFRRVNAIAVLGTLGQPGPAGQPRNPVMVVALTLLLFGGALAALGLAAGAVVAGGAWAVRRAAS
jgi:cell wall-associated NlpC family hydrolase